MLIKSIRLDLIDLEDPYRKNVDNTTLALSLTQSDLQEPLIVEGPIKGRYILVEGYRRFDSLRRIGASWVKCSVQRVTGEEGRVIKRLRNELHRKKKTGYELERMIQFLLSRGLGENEIARQAEVSTYVIKKHIKSLDVDPKLKKMAEDRKVGKDGITRLYKLPNVCELIKNELYNRYFNKEIFGYHVDSIEKVTQNPSFLVLPEESKKSCINEAISQTKFDPNQANTVVNVEMISTGIKADEEVNESVYIESIRLLNKLNQIYRFGFINDLHKNEMLYVQKLVYSLVRSTHTPWHWDDFPHDHRRDTGKEDTDPDMTIRH